MKIRVKIQDKTYEAVIDDIHTRPIQVNVDGETFEVWPEESTASTDLQKTTSASQTIQPAKKVEMDDSSRKAGQSNLVSAPIPGVIITIKVSEGDRVTYGQELCVLEAMKMKNSIRAGREGTISKIHIHEGEQVMQSKVLMEFSDKAA